MRYLVPALGTLPIERITPEVVQGMIAQLRGKVRRHTILQGMWTSDVDSGFPSWLSRPLLDAA